MAESRIDELRRRLERDPGSRLFAQLAEEYRKAGNHADAIRVARTGLAQHPSYPSARLTLGRSLLDSGDPQGARLELEAVLNDAPDNILASRFLGQALEALGEVGPALVQLQRTLKMAPGDRQLEGRIVSLQTRLRSPQPASAARPDTPPPAASPGAPTPVVAPSLAPPLGPVSRGPVAPPARPPIPPLPEASVAELPPTLRIVPPGDRGLGGRKAAGPPPLPPTAAPAAVAPAPAPPPPSVPVQTTPLAALRPPLPPRAAPPVTRPSAPAAASASEDSDLAPTLPTRRPAELGPVDETTLPTLPPRSVTAEETVFEAGAPSWAGQGPVEFRAPLEVTSPTGTPLSSSTLAELYLRQGLVERAVEVYRRVVADEPGNARARSRLAELEGPASPSGARAARRAILEQTIARLESLLAVVRRR